MYWPSYSYDIGEDGYELTAIGMWKINTRIENAVAPEDLQEISNYEMQPGYYSAALGEMDDYGSSMKIHAPTHWQPIPESPRSRNCENCGKHMFIGGSLSKSNKKTCSGKCRAALSRYKRMKNDLPLLQE